MKGRNKSEEREKRKERQWKEEIWMKRDRQIQNGRENTPSKKDEIYWSKKINWEIRIKRQNEENK